MKSRKPTILAVITTVLAAIALLIGCSKPAAPTAAPAQATSAPAAAKTINIVTGSHSPAGHPITVTMERFKELAEQRTAGRVKVEVHPNSSLYSAEEGLTATKIGTTQMWFAYEAPLTTVDPRWGVFTVPFLFKDVKHYSAFKQTQAWKSLLADMEAKGLKVVIDPAEHDSWTQIFDKSQFIKKPDDAKGKKWRVMAGKVWTAVAQKLGVSSVTISATEAYSALQTGMVEGVMTYYSGGAAYRWAEVAKYCTTADMTPGSASTVMNTAFWNSLPPDIQKTFNDIFAELGPFGAQKWVEMDAKYLQDISKMGGQTYKLTPEEKEAFVKQLGPVIDEVAVPVVGADIIKAARDTRN